MIDIFKRINFCTNMSDNYELCLHVGKSDLFHQEGEDDKRGGPDEFEEILMEVSHLSVVDNCKDVPTTDSKAVPTVSEVPGVSKAAPTDTQEEQTEGVVKCVTGNTQDHQDQFINVSQAEWTAMKSKLESLEAEVKVLQERTSAWDDIAAVKSRLAYLQSLREAKHLERTKPSGPISENYSKFYNFRKSSSKVLETQYLLDRLKPFGFPSKLLDTGRGFLSCTYAAIQYIWYGLGLAPGIDVSLPEECRSVSTFPNEALSYLGKVNPGLGSYIQNN